MANKTAGKLLRALNPLSCEEVRQRFDALLCEQLSGEEKEWVEEHVLICDECSDRFTGFIGEKVDTGEIPLEKWPSNLPLPAIDLHPAYHAPAETRLLGVIWEDMRQLATEGTNWARERLAQAERWVEGTRALLRVAPLGLEGGGLAAPAMRGEGLAAEIVDREWRLLGEMAPFEVTDGPVLTADGRFALGVRTVDERWCGSEIVCALSVIEGHRISFESTVQRAKSGGGGEARFTAEGLPRTEVDTVLPVDLLQLYLISSEGKAA